MTSPETENVGREISNEGFPAYAVVPAQQAVTIKAEKVRQALKLLRQCERDGYGVIATMTFQFENHHLPDLMLQKIKTATREIVAVKIIQAMIPLS